jgi:hypothetical protein
MQAVTGDARSARSPRRPVLNIELRPERGGALGWLPGLSVVTALGLLLIAFAFTAGREDKSWAEAGFWVALAVIFVPTMARLTTAAPSRRERLGLVAMLGLALYAAKVLQEPTAFTYHDELGHWRTVDDILRTGGLFDFNPVTRAYAYYPGIDVVTASLVKLGSSSILFAGVVVLAGARLVLAPALFWLFEDVSGSARLAGIGAALYMTNPNFLFFDSQFAYESFALPLLIFSLLIVRRWAYSRERTGLGVLFAVVALAVVMSHHMDAYALSALLVVWTVASAVVRRRLAHAPGKSVPRWLISGTSPKWPALLVVGATAAWFAFVAGGATTHELGPVFSGLVDGVKGLLGSGSDKQLFKSGSGHTEPLWTQALGFASVGIILAGLAIGLWRLRRRPLSSAALALVLITLIYPLTLVLRLTQAGTETSNRAAEFLFLGIALVLAFAGVEVLLQRTRAGVLERARRGLGAPIVVGLATVLLLGGVAIGWPPYGRVPGHFLVGGDLRSISPQGTAAAHFAAREMPAHSRISTDRTTALLMASYGRQNPVGGKINGLSVVSIFFSPVFGERERSIVSGDKLRYIAVDRRLSQSLPTSGVYFERGEPGAQAHRQPISPSALAKFAHVRGLSRIYDNGAIAIYDANAILQEPR